MGKSRFPTSSWAEEESNGRGCACATGEEKGLDITETFRVANNRGRLRLSNVVHGLARGEELIGLVEVRAFTCLTSRHVTNGVRTCDARFKLLAVVSCFSTGAFAFLPVTLREDTT